MVSFPDKRTWARRAALYRRGMTLREIAEREGVTPASVFVMLRKVGVEMRPPGRRPGPASPTYVELAARLRAKGLSLAEIGARVGRSGEAVRLALKRRRPKRT